MRKIHGGIIHCSDSDHDHHDDVSVMRRWHVDERGWSDVGYHFFIKKDGTIQTGRPLYKVGAHCGGHNRGTVGICLHGKTEFTEAQFKSLAKLLKTLMDTHDFLMDEIYGHYHFSSKTCPNFDVTEFKKKYIYDGQES
jgi:N-acetyl-anhydromuramyl-L-alanine amidase AmpD